MADDFDVEAMLEAPYKEKVKSNQSMITCNVLKFIWKIVS